LGKVGKMREKIGERREGLAGRDIDKWDMHVGR
jgi:hypothetical protein